MTAKIIDGKAIAADIRAEVAKGAADLRAKGVIPGLATVLVWENVPALSGTGLYSMVPGFVAATGAVLLGSGLSKPDADR